MTSPTRDPMIDRSEEEWDALMEALSTVYGLRATNATERAMRKLAETGLSRLVEENKVEIAAAADAYSDAWVAGRFDLADEAREEMNDLKHLLFLTGVVEEGDQ